MLIIQVHVRVKPECIEAFRHATIENARQSEKEPGVARFDVLQQIDDPAKFVLIEAYRNADAPIQHKETAHYQTWRDSVGPMIAEPRISLRFSNVHPGDQDW